MSDRARVWIRKLLRETVDAEDRSARSLLETAPAYVRQFLAAAPVLAPKEPRCDACYDTGEVVTVCDGIPTNPQPCPACRTTPKEEMQPVAEVVDAGFGADLKWRVNPGDFEVGTKLYASPVPLTAPTARPEKQDSLAEDAARWREVLRNPFVAIDRILAAVDTHQPASSVGQASQRRHRRRPETEMNNTDTKALLARAEKHAAVCRRDGQKALAHFIDDLAAAIRKNAQPPAAQQAVAFEWDKFKVPPAPAAPEQPCKHFFDEGETVCEYCGATKGDSNEQR